MFPFVILVNATGWRQSSYIVGAFTLTLAAMIWLFVRDDGPNHVDLPRPGFAAMLRVVYRGFLDIVKNKRSMPPFFGFLLVFGGLMTFTGLWGTPFLMQVHGISQSTAGSLLMLTTAGAATAAVFVGWLTDRSGKPKLMFCALASLQVIAWIIILWSIGKAGQPGVIPAIAAALVLMGASNSSFLPAFVVMRNANKPEISSMAQGLNNASGFIGAIILQALVSAVMDMGWKGDYFTEGVRLYSASTYRTGFLLSLGAVALAIVFGLMMPKDRKI